MKFLLISKRFGYLLYPLEKKGGSPKISFPVSYVHRQTLDKTLLCAKKTGGRQTNERAYKSSRVSNGEAAKRIGQRAKEGAFRLCKFAFDLVSKIRAQLSQYSSNAIDPSFADSSDSPGRIHRLASRPARITLVNAIKTERVESLFFHHRFRPIWISLRSRQLPSVNFPRVTGI